MELELIKNLAQGAFGLAMWYLYRELRKEMVTMALRYEADRKQSYNRWLNDIRYMAKLPTDLEGDYKLGPDSPVKA